MVRRTTVLAATMARVIAIDGGIELLSPEDIGTLMQHVCFAHVDGAVEAVICWMG